MNLICPQQSKRLLLFSGNDYLGMSSHPTIGNAAAKVWLMKGLAGRYRSVEVFIYQHCDMSHLNELL
jgi:7-keto-8-aminopelargonate synthetase-like enzyme